jgi:F0F1-type ATP synthase assembly protein I
MISIFIGLGILVYLTIGWFQGRWIGNRPLFHIGVLGVVAGVQLFTLGLIGEMIVEKSTRGQPPLSNDSDLINTPRE